MKLTTHFVSYLISEGESCCSNAETEDCKEACTNMFQSELPFALSRQHFAEACETSSPRVTKCVKDIIKETPAINTQKRK